MLDDYGNRNPCMWIKNLLYIVHVWCTMVLDKWKNLLWHHKVIFIIFSFVNILEKPTVEVSETITQTGTTVIIHCTTSVEPGSPAVTSIKWLLSGQIKDISDSNKYSGGNPITPSLTIYNIASTDAGKYQCVATNLVGSTTSSQSVTLGKIISILWNSAISAIHFNCLVVTKTMLGTQQCTDRRVAHYFVLKKGLVCQCWHWLSLSLICWPCIN